MVDQERLLTASEAARLLECSAQTVRLYADKGMVATIHTEGGMRLFRRADLVAFKRLLRPGRPKAE